MYVDEKALAKYTPSSRRRDEIASRNTQIQVYQAEVVEEPPRVVVLAMDSDSKNKPAHPQLPGDEENQTFTESLTVLDSEVSYKNKQRLAAIIAGIFMVATAVLGTVISLPM